MNEKEKESMANKRYRHFFQSNEDGLKRWKKIHKEYFFCPRVLTKVGEALTDFEFRVLTVLLEELEEGNPGHVPIARIAVAVGRSEKKIIKVIKDLKEKLIISKEKVQKKDGNGVYNIFEIEKVARWWKEIGLELKEMERKAKLKKYTAKEKPL